MTKTAKQDKQMEYGMVEFNFLDTVDDSTGGIGKSTGNKPEQTLG